MSERFYLGIDVGTGSARAGIFDERGIRAGMGTHPIQHWQPQPDFHEQSSEDIWRACCSAVRVALQQAEISAEFSGSNHQTPCKVEYLAAEEMSCRQTLVRSRSVIVQQGLE